MERKFLVWNGIWKKIFSMEWKIFGMEWKKIASMEYGKIVFHSIPYHALIERATDVLRLAWERASTACDFDIPPISQAKRFDHLHMSKKIYFNAIVSPE